MLFRPPLYEATAGASYLFGCLSASKLAVVHALLVDVPPAPPDHAAIDAANRAGRVVVEA
ncbi:MAG: hypothetical protein ICV59_09935 [Thermoleophilia bacterium]|nr:hypothetical protein [Thermoleophilia bacterium]